MAALCPAPKFVAKNLWGFLSMLGSLAWSFSYSLFALALPWDEIKCGAFVMVVGLKDVNKNLGIVLSEIEGEEMGWVVCVWLGRLRM